MRHSFFRGKSVSSHHKQRAVLQRPARSAARVLIESLEARQLLSAALDTSFGGDGIISTPPLQDIAPLADNKILTTRIDSLSGPSTLKLTRYNADGSLDT